LSETLYNAVNHESNIKQFVSDYVLTDEQPSLTDLNWMKELNLYHKFVLGINKDASTLHNLVPGSLSLDYRRIGAVEKIGAVLPKREAYTD